MVCDNGTLENHFVYLPVSFHRSLVEAFDDRHGLRAWVGVGPSLPRKERVEAVDLKLIDRRVHVAATINIDLSVRVETLADIHVTNCWD